MNLLLYRSVFTGTSVVISHSVPVDFNAIIFIPNVWCSPIPMRVLFLVLVVFQIDHCYSDRASALLYRLVFTEIDTLVHRPTTPVRSRIEFI